MTETAEALIPEFTVGDRLRKARESTGLGQSEFADEIGVSRQSVSNYELGNTAPRKIVLLAWSMRTSVPVSWLVDGVVSETESNEPRSGHKLLRLRDDLGESDRPASTEEILSFRKQLHGAPKRPNRRIEAVRS